MAVHTVDENAKKPKNQTMPYNGDGQGNLVSGVGKNESLASVAERTVIERHGPQARNLPNFKELVKDEETQMKASIDNTKGM